MLAPNHHLAWPYRTLQSPVLGPREPAARPAPTAQRLRAPAPITEDMRIRLATPDDAHALARLAALDSAPPLNGAALIAERNGVPLAGLALGERRTVADPFLPTRDVLALLALRADQIAAAEQGVPSSRRPRIRLWARDGAV
jgi:hypothetical protein